MSCLGFKTAVYHGELCLGELDTIPVTGSKFQFPNNEIRIDHISPNSERCPPLAILQTISTFVVRCKLESSLPNEQPDLIKLHASCFYEFKTAVVFLGDEEIHLVAMPSKQKKFPCFWCYCVPSGLYNACLGMLNLRCLAIVFDLDETLIVANTMKSFEDRIDALRAWMTRETDLMRLAGMSTELKRYADDRMLLKQFIDSDFVMDNGRVCKVQQEEVPSLSEGQEKIIRPVIRLHDKNIVLTRINPEIRDTSVLVRLRPAWEDLRSYLTAKGRKRFEVYVCTMAERDYALEMWRLLDPESSLISSKQLQDRVVCVKSGSKKSLLNVFQDSMCHPKMAMVIDDRLKVWEDKDQPQVHVVPAFSPYYAPQAETANAVPVLCVARNVACNVRGSFFWEFDESLLRRISDVFYEDEVINLPHGPEVSNYLMSEDAGFVPNGNTNAPISDGLNGVEVQHRLNQSDEKSLRDSSIPSASNNLELRPERFLPMVSTISGLTGPTTLASLPALQKPSLLGAPTKRDLSSSGQPPLLSKPQISPYGSQSKGGWLVEEENNKHMQNRASGASQGSETSKQDKVKAHQNPVPHTTAGSTSSGSLSPASEPPAKNLQKHNGQPSDVGLNLNGKEIQTILPSHLAIGVLTEIGRKCSSKVEFRSVLSTSKDLQFSIEALFSGEKIGVGMGKTRKDAQQQAAGNAIRTLADKYEAYAHTGTVDRDLNNLSLGKDNGFLWDDDEDPGFVERPRKEGGLTKESSAEATRVQRGSTSNLPNQQGKKRASSPRLIHPIPSKRLKEGVQHS